MGGGSHHSRSSKKPSFFSSKGTSSTGGSVGYVTMGSQTSGTPATNSTSKKAPKKHRKQETSGESGSTGRSSRPSRPVQRPIQRNLPVPDVEEEDSEEAELQEEGDPRGPGSAGPPESTWGGDSGMRPPLPQGTGPPDTHGSMMPSGLETDQGPQDYGLPAFGQGAAPQNSAGGWRHESQPFYNTGLGAGPSSQGSKQATISTTKYGDPVFSRNLKGISEGRWEKAGPSRTVTTSMSRTDTQEHGVPGSEEDGQTTVNGDVPEDVETEVPPWFPQAGPRGPYT